MFFKLLGTQDRPNKPSRFKVPEPPETAGRTQTPHTANTMKLITHTTTVDCNQTVNIGNI
jgi:hypothetical protein